MVTISDNRHVAVVTNGVVYPIDMKSIANGSVRRGHCLRLCCDGRDTWRISRRVCACVHHRTVGAETLRTDYCYIGGNLNAVFTFLFISFNRIAKKETVHLIRWNNHRLKRSMVTGRDEQVHWSAPNCSDTSTSSAQLSSIIKISISNINKSQYTPTIFLAI